jgi:DNA-binding NarL/FixJ family response regulator
MKVKKVNRASKTIRKSKTKPTARKSHVELSDRKKQIIKLVCRQMTSQEIGDKLGLSKKTIEVYRLQIFSELKIKNNVGLAVWAIKNGLFKV